MKSNSRLFKVTRRISEDVSGDESFSGKFQVSRMDISLMLKLYFIKLTSSVRIVNWDNLIKVAEIKPLTTGEVHISGVYVYVRVCVCVCVFSYIFTTGRRPNDLKLLAKLL